MKPKEPVLVTLDQIILELDRELKIDAEACGRHSYTKGYLYKLIYQREIKRYGPKHIALVDRDEVLQRLLGRTA